MLPPEARPILPPFAMRALLVAVFSSAIAHAGVEQAPAASSPSGSGAHGGESTPGFDVTGSHPLPNANDRDAPGRGACACSFGDRGRGGSGRAKRATLSFAALILVIAAGRRRACHT